MSAPPNRRLLLSVLPDFTIRFHLGMELKDRQPLKPDDGLGGVPNADDQTGKGSELEIHHVGQQIFLHFLNIFEVMNPIA